MDGRPQRGSPGHGRSSRHGSSSRRAGAASAAGSGAVTTTTSRKAQAVPAAPSAPATRAVYRLLLMKGMTATEAASLTAFMCGLPTSDLQWSLKQVYQLLFLRRMREIGRFGDTDGGAARPH